MRHTPRRPSPPRRASQDSGEAFLHDTAREGGTLPDDAEDFAEEFIQTATSAEDAFSDAADELVVEELGGPYLELDATRQADWFSTDDDAGKGSRP